MLDGGANQLTEMISPALIFQQLWAMASNASSLFYFVDNVSDMLPVPLSTAATLAFAWDPHAFARRDGGPNDWNATQKAFLVRWASTQYGGAVGGAVGTLYESYFNLPHLQKGSSDEMIGASLGNLAGLGSRDVDAQGWPPTNATRVAAQQHLGDVRPSLAPCASLQAAAAGAAPSIPARRAQFYAQHMLWPVACQHFGVVAISELAQSLLAADIGEAVAHANASITALDALFAAQRAAEGTGEWSGVYFGDRLPYTNLQGRRRAVLNYRAALLRLPPVHDSGKGYYSMYQYQNPAVANYPLFYYNPAWNLREFVLMNCTGLNSPDGGTFDGGTTITFLSTLCRGAVGTVLPPGPFGGEPVGAGDMLPLENCSATFRAKYTVDGSWPGNSSTALVYEAPFVITQTTTIRAQLAGPAGAGAGAGVDTGADRPLVHTMTYTKSGEP